MIKEGKIKNQKKLEPISDRDLPHPIPESWSWSKIGNYSLNTEYGLSEKTSDSNAGVPVLKMGDIEQGRIILGGQQTVPESTDKLAQLMLCNGDILYNRTNSAELVGKTGIYLGKNYEYTFASYLIRVQPSHQHSSALYLNMAMNAPRFRETQIVPHLKQQCGQANVNGTILKNMIVPVPPLKEQHRIVKKVDEVMALCDQLKARLNQAQTLQHQLADAVSQSV